MRLGGGEEIYAEVSEMQKVSVMDTNTATVLFLSLTALTHPYFRRWSTNVGPNPHNCYTSDARMLGECMWWLATLPGMPYALTYFVWNSFFRDDPQVIGTSVAIWIALDIIYVTIESMRRDARNFIL